MKKGNGIGDDEREAFLGDFIPCNQDPITGCGSERTTSDEETVLHLDCTSVNILAMIRSLLLQCYH